MRSKDRFLLLAFLVILVVFGALVARKYLATSPSPPLAAAPAPQPRQLRDVVLYFGAPDGTFLTAEGREIDDCLEESDCVKETIQALINGPVGNLTPIFPAHTLLKGVQEEGKTALVDFSNGLIAGHPAGSVSELLTVYGLADTLAENFPHIRQVRILVNGKAVDTIKGHVDLRQPVVADFHYCHPPTEAGATAGEGAESGTPQSAAPQGAQH
ncbi:MAG TPA: GerMN domain-containing protein [Desulfuromonadales bacterium]|nr:GerMN domain-containing protein [Desulfuromonadales bacterium]